MSEAVYIVSAVRTPIGKFGGSLMSFTAADLGVVAVRAALARAFGTSPEERKAGVPSEKWVVGSGQTPDGGRDAMAPVQELIFGNARPAGVGPNVARQIAWRAGLPEEAPAFAVNMACASGLRAVTLGWERIRLGEAGVVVAGGTESMSRVPHLIEARWGVKMGHQQVVDAMYRDGFVCPMSQSIMGETAETLAEMYKISRQEQDEFAFESQQRAARAAAQGRFASQTVSMELRDKKGNVTEFATDEHVRADTTIGSLAKLPPVFAKTGTITAGNSSGLTDAASAVVLASERRVRELELKPLARIVDATIAAVEPRVMGVAPVPAVRKLEQRTGWKLGDYDAVELNEAFAAQVIACDRELHFDRAKLNPNGGAIALGHPIGATGTRILTTLVHELKRAGAKRGLATLCVSGGLAMAVAVESV